MGKDTNENAFKLRTDFKPQGLPLQAVMGVLMDPPDPELLDLPVGEYVMGLSGAVLQAIHDEGFDLVRRMGKASWVWSETIQMQVPSCSALVDDGDDESHLCLAFLVDRQIPNGVCDDHDLS